MQTFDDPLDSSLDESNSNEIELSEEIADYWLSISGWAFFIACLFLLGAGVLLFLILIASHIAWSTLLVMLGLIMVCFIPALLLIRFRSNLKRALFDDSPERLEKSFRAFRYFYLLVGLLMIAITVLYAGLIAYGLYLKATNPVPGMPEDF